jgi:S1-C subfamily serine protease
MPDLATVTSSVTRPLMEMIVFPIIKALYYGNGTEVHTLIGTGFFFDSTGLFLTARHVFEDRGSAFDLEGASGLAVYCVHSVDLARKMVARRIDVSSVKTHRETDIAAGRVEKNQFGQANDSITQSDLRLTAHFNHMTSTDIPVGTRVWTVAYPLATISNQPGHVQIHSQSDAYEGQITAHYPGGRDRGLMHWPCYETDMEIKKGASGGPVFVAGSGGVVFGVNCTGFDPHSVSYVSSLVPLVPTPGAA